MSIQRIGREQRLRLKSDFENLRDQGMSRSNTFLVVRTVPNGLKHSRYGFIVSKRTSPLAVNRNRIKRILRDVISRIPLREERDILFIARKSALNATHAELLNATWHLCSKLELLHADGRETTTSKLR